MTSREPLDPYIVLGVPRQASSEEISRAYRRAARASHPDGGEAGSGARFQAVSDAYDVLRDPGRRALYDRSNPLVRARSAGVGGGSARYAVPGLQHLVLGRAALSEPLHAQLLADELDASRSGRRVGDAFRITLWWLRTNR